MISYSHLLMVFGHENETARRAKGNVLIFNSMPKSLSGTRGSSLLRNLNELEGYASQLTFKWFFINHCCYFYLLDTLL